MGNPGYCMKPARYTTNLNDKKVLCTLCPHQCVIADSKAGICMTRKNLDGMLFSENYCRPVSLAIDPIEKKPLYHFYPGSRIFSTGPNGCNLKCSFCQNHEISQSIINTSTVSEDDFVERIIQSGTKGIAYTYSEPYIWFETIMAIGPRIKQAGLVNVMVTNGYMEPEPLRKLLTVVDAMNIDIKSIKNDFYKRLCRAELGPVLRTCETVKKQCHLEITNLLITGANDTEKEMRTLVDYIATYLGKDTPLHISRYFPRHKFSAPATEIDVLINAGEIAKSKLDYVYIGNIISDAHSHTFCPNCKTLLISRSGYTIHITDALIHNPGEKGLCKTCGSTVPIVL